MNNAIKVGKVFSHIQQLKGDICFLQETHIRTTQLSRIKKPWMGHLFHSKFSETARGAAIIIHRNIAFELNTTVSDPNGRYVIVTGKLQNTPVVLASVYAPTWDDDRFISNFFSSIPNLNDYQIIIGGDFNLVQNLALDKSSNKQTSLSKSAKVLKYHADQLGLSDPWRSRFPTQKAFSFFSPVHHSFSRIDFFLIDNTLLHNVQSCDYHSIVISDHAPTSIEINFPHGRPPSRFWRFSPQLMSEPSFKDLLTSQIKFFFETNDTPDIDSNILWETFKAYLRGQIISYVSNYRKLEQSQLIQISTDVRSLDDQYSVNPSPALYTKRLQLQAQYDLLSTGKVERQLLQSRQRYFEQGDKAGKLLAYQAKVANASRLIPRIQMPDGEIVTDPAKISKTFSDYYTNLYASETCTQDWEEPNPLDNLEYPQVGENLINGLGAPLTVLEVSEAIKSLQSGKSPGPDGYTTEFFKTFSDALAPILVRVYNDAFSKGRLPPSLSEASITLLLKKDKDPLLCSSYRPISLLNVDFKIMAKALASRLQRVLPDLVDNDQTGFIPGRLSTSNTRRLFNIIYSPASDSPELVSSLDAEKAFDRVEWRYLFYILDKFGFGPNFISWIKLLYSSPVASVNVNGVKSDQFPLSRGNRQGCPLSPSLFALVVEPLAIWLRREERFQGITRFGTTHKVSFYADDLLLYISNPSSSIPAILNILDNFKRLSGYKLNLQKSEYFPVNDLADRIPHSSFPFKKAVEGFKYLGIIVTKTFTELFAKNFSPLVERFKEDLARWSTLPLSLLGRVNLIKMVVLPRFLYPFQHIPIFINKSFFSTIDRLIKSFLWCNKRARIRASVLQLPKSEGGLALPNLRHYYWASNIHKIIFWNSNLSSDIQPQWAKMEANSSNLSLWSVVCSQLPLPVKRLSKNPIVVNTLKIWAQFRKQFGLLGPSKLAPVYKNHCFLPSCTDPVFRIWSDKGLRSINDLYTDNVFSSFADLSNKFGLPNSHMFRFFQIRHFIQNQNPQFPNRPPDSMLDSFLSLEAGIRKLTSIIYDVISGVIPSRLESLRAAWDQDLGIVMSDDQWEQALDLVHTSSICARHKLLQCKILHRVHYTNAKLARIYPDRSDACNRCKQSPADYMHMFWSCPKLTTFWSAVFNSLGAVLGEPVDLDPLTALFGIPLMPNVSSSARRIIAFTTLLARRLILLKWIHPSPPTHNRWIQEILYCVKLEKIRFSLNGSLEKFHKTWQPFLNHIDTLTILEERT